MRVGDDKPDILHSCLEDLGNTVLKAMRANWPETEEWNDEDNQGVEVRPGGDTQDCRLP